MYKKLLIIFCVLIMIFIGVWVIKLRQPIDSTNETTISEDAPWWETIREGETPIASSDWVLDPEIPTNYVPVIGQKELYMVVKDDGGIEKYRQRTQESDGTWVWSDTDPHIPDNYIAVEGLENVYRVQNVDGTIKHYRYARNPDDSYYFTEVDDKGNEIVATKDNADEIPQNYVHLSGNVYAVYNEYGVLTGYKERYTDADGNYQWRDCQKPQEKQQQQQNASSGSESSKSNKTEAQAEGSGGDINIYNEGDFVIDNSYQEKEMSTETKVEGSWNVVYETTVLHIYDAGGKLIATKKEGPTEVNRYPATGFTDKK